MDKTYEQKCKMLGNETIEITILSVLIISYYLKILSGCWKNTNYNLQTERSNKHQCFNLLFANSTQWTQPSTILVGYLLRGHCGPVMNQRLFLSSTATRNTSEINGFSKTQHDGKIWISINRVSQQKLDSV